MVPAVVTLFASLCLLADTPAETLSHTYSVQRNLAYSEAGAEGEKLLLDAYLPDDSAGPRPAILVVHGGSWRSGNKAQLAGYAIRLAKSGYAAFAINYRLAPKYKHPCQIDDCRAALRWIVEHADEFQVDTDRIGAIGYSAGAHLVFLLGMAGGQTAPDSAEGDATLPRLRAVVAGGSPCDFTVVKERSRTLVDFLGGTMDDAVEQYRNASPAFYLTADDPPIFFFHGTSDELVTIRGPEIMVERLKKLGVEASLYRVDQGNHISAAFHRGAIDEAVAFFDRHLQTP